MRSNNLFLFSCLFLLTLLLGGGCLSNKHHLILSEEEYEQKIAELSEPGRQKIAQLLEAAERGDVEAQYQIGYEYIRPLPMPVRHYAGLGIVQGEGIRGIRWYSKDTQQRAVFAIDHSEGIKWFRQAELLGHEGASEHLRRMEVLAE